MFARRLKCRNQKWCFVFKLSPGLTRSGGGHCIHSHSVANSIWEQRFKDKLINKYQEDASLGPSFFFRDCTTRFNGRYNALFTISGSRFYSSKGDESNASEGKHVPTKDSTHSDKGKPRREKTGVILNYCDDHARLGEHDQLEWLKSEKLSLESKRKESPFLTRRQKFKNEFLRRLIPCEKINVSWDTFPYYMHEHTRNTLVECVASHLRHKKFTASYGGSLTSSSGRILLQSFPGMELYLERLVRALAGKLQVPLLVLDGSVLAPHGFGEELALENETDAESGEECTSDSDVEEENDASNEEEWASGNEARSDGTDEDDMDAKASAEVLKKLVPYNTTLEDFAKRVSGEHESDTSASEKADSTDTTEQSKRPLKKGDRVKYVGSAVTTEVENRSISRGSRGEVYEVNGEQVAVILDDNVDDMKDNNEMETAEEALKPSIYWFDVQDIEHDLEIQAEDWFIAVEALSEVLPQLEPLIVYFPDPSQWLSRAVPKSKRKEFIHKIEEMFDQLSGPVVLICGQSKPESAPKEKEKLTMVFPNIRLGRLPIPLRRLTEGLAATKTTKDDGIYKLFENILFVHPPKEDELLKVLNKQLEEDGKIVALRRNLYELQKVLEGHNLTCLELLHLNFDDVNLTKQKAEKVVGWARNHYLSSCACPSTKNDKLVLPRVSMEIALSRLKEQETTVRKPVQSLKALAKDEYESNFVSAVVPPDEIGVKFNDIGALEDVKRTLNELVILPMRRPELFSRGNLLRPCKGILLFGPPGTGKTLLAKALATEAGANFISITGSTLTSKWFGDAEKLTKALFSFATKLAPVIIFVDEVDSLLGARGGAFEHEATRRMRNEFMAAWDGLRTKDTQKILILGATNRPFDLDDAVIRRLPRRIYIDLPDADNRKKILKIFLAHENLDPGFQYDELANATDGYSGSDLKNLCIAAAYRPVQELLEEEKKIGAINAAPILRPLCLDDFFQAKAKVGASVAYDATSMNELRKWNDQYGEGGSRKQAPFGFGD